MDSNPDILEVSPRGDIMLVVGPLEEKQLRLKVSSIFLRSASKVFDAMFSPPWLESSRTLSPDSPQDIELPEDDLEAMKAICYAIHHRPDMIPLVDLNGKQILQAVRTIDKYDLSTAMQLVTDRWLRQMLRAKSVEDLLYMAAAAAGLKNYKAFSKLTWLVMIQHEGSYLRFQNDDQLRELFPPGMFFLLAERTFLIRAHLSTALQDVEPCSNCKCSCAEALRNTVKLVRHSHGYNSKNSKAILELLKDMIELAHAQNQFQSRRCASGYNYNVTHELASCSLDEKLPDWTYSATSLCLQCLEVDPSLEKDCKHKEEPDYPTQWVTNAELDSLFTY